MAMPTEQETQRLQQAAIRLAKNPDFKFILTTLKNECIQDFKASDATPEQLVEAHRRHTMADDILQKVKTYGATTNAS